mmetsp:Transcript_44327/g.103453  ORF Transcript_44327/g.103453 Transcript_44327/m.103453 type:complete len:206 (+) Transcript_44327:89-706(+)
MCRFYCSRLWRFWSLPKENDASWRKRERIGPTQPMPSGHPTSSVSSSPGSWWTSSTSCWIRRRALGCRDCKSCGRITCETSLRSGASAAHHLSPTSTQWPVSRRPSRSIFKPSAASWIREKWLSVFWTTLRELTAHRLCRGFKFTKSLFPCTTPPLSVPYTCRELPMPSVNAGSSSSLDMCLRTSRRYAPNCCSCAPTFVWKRRI